MVAHETPRGCSFTLRSELSLRSAKWTVQTCASRWFSVSLWKTWLQPASCFAKNRKIPRLNFLRVKIKKKEEKGIHSLARKFESDKYAAKGRVHSVETMNAYEGCGVDLTAFFIPNLNTILAPRVYAPEKPAKRPLNRRLGGRHKQCGSFGSHDNQTTICRSSSQQRICLSPEALESASSKRIWKMWN